MNKKNEKRRIYLISNKLLFNLSVISDIIKNMETKIIFFENEDGKSLAWDAIMDVIERGSAGNKLYEELGIYIRKGLAYIEQAGIPPWEEVDGYLMVDRDEKGVEVTFNLLKRLKFHKPLLEFRINRRKNPNDKVIDGLAFRLILFTEIIDNIQCVFLTDGMVKKERSPAAFPIMIKKSEGIYKKIISNISKYKKE